MDMNTISFGPYNKVCIKKEPHERSYSRAHFYLHNESTKIIKRAPWSLRAPGYERPLTEYFPVCVYAREFVWLPGVLVTAIFSYNS